MVAFNLFFIIVFNFFFGQIIITSDHCYILTGNKNQDDFKISYITENGIYQNKTKNH